MPLTNPFTNHVAITPSDSVDIGPTGGPGPVVCDSVFVGGAGIVALVTQNNTVVNYTCPAGCVLPVRTRRVNATNTTATLMVALYNA